MVRRGEIKEREKKGGFKKVRHILGRFLPLRLYTCASLSYNANAHQPVCVKPGDCYSDRHREHSGEGSASSGQAHAPLFSTGIQLWHIIFSLFLFYLKSQLERYLGIYSLKVHLFARKNLRDAYALQSLCVYKMQAQHFSLPPPPPPVSPFNLWLSYNTISPYNHWISLSRLTWDK